MESPFVRLLEIEGAPGYASDAHGLAWPRLVVWSAKAWLLEER